MTGSNGHTQISDSTEAEIDEAVIPIAETRAHWSLFLPSVLVALIYGLAWALLAISGQGNGALAKIMFLVLVVAPPVLLAHAFLRFKSVGIALTNRHVLVAKGWPRMEGQQFEIEDIAKIGFRSSAIGRQLGVGKITLRLTDGRNISVSDVADPNAICTAIQHHIASP